MGKINWFPGHMAKAFNALNRIVKGVDLVLEFRDARIPTSSANPKLDKLLHGKRHIVVLNKVDLVTKSSRQAALHHLQHQGLLALPASSNDPKSVKQLMRAAVGWLERERANSELSIMLVVGLPNSGKSSLINALKLAAKAAGSLAGEEAYQRRAAVGPTPGLTRQVRGFQVSAAPLTYVLDSPGVMMPNIPSDEAGFKLALAGAIKDSIVGEEAIVRYLVNLLTTQPRHFAALHASQQPGFRSPSSSSRSSSGSTACWDAAARKRQESRVKQMRAALEAAMQLGVDRGSTEGRLLARAAAASYMTGAELSPWHPGDEDAAYEASDLQLDVLLQQLGVAGGLNPTLQQGAYMRLLQAFRAGELGLYMLDDVE